MPEQGADEEILPDSYPGVFILGSGRCGSTLFSSILRQHPKILSISEFLSLLMTRCFAYGPLSGEAVWAVLSKPSPIVRTAFAPQNCPVEFLYRFGPKAAFTPENLPPILYMMLPHLTEDPDSLYFELEAVIRPRPRAPLADHYRFLFAWLCRRFGKSIWMERSGGSIIHAPSLVKHFPDAKFVHVLRDGRDVALSISKHKTYSAMVRAWALLHYGVIDITRWPYRVGGSFMVALFEPIVSPILHIGDSLNAPVQATTSGRFWSRLMEMGCKALDKLPPERRLDVRYEDIVAKPEETLTRFINFVDPNLADETWLQEACRLPGARPSQWPALPQRERQSLERACRPGLRRLGYL